jgi:hypothetical protein
VRVVLGVGISPQRRSLGADPLVWTNSKVAAHVVLLGDGRQLEVPNDDKQNSRSNDN